MQNSFISKININHLKIFESVYRLKSMTLAAQELFLTQSGVSQHIKNLEDDLHLSLFVRNKSEFFSTPAADELFQSCQKAFADIEAALDKLGDSSPKDLEGLIRIGVPTEFGNNVLIPLVAEWAAKNMKVKFDFVYGYGSHLTELLEDGKIDIAFIDSLKSQRLLSSKIVFQENLNLVVALDYLKRHKLQLKSSAKERINQLVNFDFIEYEHKESILRMWFHYHYSKKNIPLNIKVWAMNVQGVAAFIKAGMGAAVLPNHVIDRISREGVLLHVFKGTKENLKNEISIAWLKHKPLSRAVVDLRDFIINHR